MAKGTHLTPEVKSLIALTHLEHPDYGPTKVREKLLKRMKETGLDLNFGPDWPSVSAVGKVLTDIRKEESKLGPDPEDRPWSVSALALADCDIPPEALPAVMKAWAKAHVADAPLSIRQVKWVARLYCILGNVEGLIVRALEYAKLEKAIKLSGAYPDKPENMFWLWFNDAWLYLDIKGKDIGLAKRLMAMYGIKWEESKKYITKPARREAFRRGVRDGFIKGFEDGVKDAVKEEAQQNEDSNTTKRTDFH